MLGRTFFFGVGRWLVWFDMGEDSELYVRDERVVVGVV